MAGDPARQERTGAAVLSLGSVLVAVLERLDRPGPGEIEELGPDWYMDFTVILQGAILLLLLVGLTRLPRMTADRPALRVPFLIMILVGIAAAAYVVARDLGMV